MSNRRRAKVRRTPRPRHRRDLNDPAVRIAAVTGEDPDAILWCMVRLIESGLEPDEVALVCDRAVEAGQTIAETVDAILGSEEGTA